MDVKHHERKKTIVTIIRFLISLIVSADHKRKIKIVLIADVSLISLMISVDVKHHKRKIKIVLIADVSLISLMISVDIKHHGK